MVEICESKKGIGPVHGGVDVGMGGQLDKLSIQMKWRVPNAPCGLWFRLSFGGFTAGIPGFWAIGQTSFNIIIREIQDANILTFPISVVFQSTGE